MSAPKIPFRADVRLAPLGPEHAERMLAWMGDPNLRSDLGVRSEPSLERTRAWIARATRDPTFAPFAIEADGHHVGNVILDCIDSYLGTARVTIYVGAPNARLVGVGKSALLHACRHGFDVLGLAKIWLTVHQRNYPAICAYTRLGFALEGIHRGEFLIGKHRIDAFYFGLMREDYYRLAMVEDSKPDDGASGKIVPDHG